MLRILSGRESRVQGTSGEQHEETLEEVGSGGQKARPPTLRMTDRLMLELTGPVTIVLFRCLILKSGKLCGGRLM